ncbi:hypothetical protein PTKIN_Ptkin09bG0283800 [Pterospermum kingtungense]
MEELREWLDVVPKVTMFPALKELRIEECPSLSRNPIISRFSSLEKLTIPIMVSLPSTTSTAPLKLVGWKKLSSLSHQLQHLTALEGLSIHYFSAVKALPEWFGNLSNLKRLGLGPFSEDQEECPDLSFIFLFHSSLRELTLYGWEKLSSLPHQLQHLTNLKELKIRYFSGVKALPEWLRNLSSIRKLKIRDFVYVEHLPSKEAMQRLYNLQYITILKCPGLRGNSAEGSKISNISRITR